MAKDNSGNFIKISANVKKTVNPVSQTSQIKETSDVNNNNSTSQISMPTMASVDKADSLLPDHAKAREETLAKINTHYKQGIEYFKAGKLDGAEQELVQAMKPVLSKNTMRALYVELEDCKEQMLDAMYHLGKIYERSENYQGNYSKAAAIFQYCSEFAKKYAVNTEIDYIKEAYATEAKFLVSAGIKGKAKNHEDYQKQVDYYKEGLALIRTTVGALVEEIRDWLITRIAERAKEVEGIYAECTKFFVNHEDNSKQGKTGLIQRLLQECYEQLGQVPQGCEHAVIGFGSLAGGKMTPWSDLEFGILINEDKPEYKEYFRNLTKLLHIKVINLGETPLRSIGIESLNNFKTAQAKDDWFWDEVMTSGVSFDGAHWHACKLPLGRQGYKAEERVKDKSGIEKKVIAEKPDYELILTPGQMAEFQKEQGKQGWYGSDKHLVQALKSVALIDGSQGLLDTYRKTVQVSEDKAIVQARALEILAEDVDNFSLKLGDKEEGKLFDVKKGIYRVGDRIVEALANYYGIEPEPGQPKLIVWEVIDKMAIQGLLAPEGAEHLKEAISIATELRLATYCHNKGQKEGVSTYVPAVEHLKEAQRKQILEETFFVKDTSILHHFYYVVLRLQFLVQGLVSKSVHELTEFALRFDNLFEQNEHTKGLVHARFLEYEKALRYLELAKEKMPEDLLVLNDLYFLQSKVGKVEATLNTAKEMLDLKKNALEDGVSHPEVAKSYNNLGEAYYVKGEYDQAISCYNQGLGIQRQVYADNLNNPEIGACYNNLGNTYHAKGNYEEAIKHHQLSLEIRQQAYIGNPHHPEIGACYNNLGLAYFAQGKYDQAISCYIQGLEIQRQAYANNPNHPEIAKSYNNLGNVYRAKGEHDKEIEYHQLSLAISQKIYGSNATHPGIAISYNNLGLAYFAKGYYGQAISYHQLSLEMRKQIYGSNSNHPDIAMSYSNLGSICKAQGKYEESIWYNKLSLEIRKQACVSNPNHPDIAKSYNNLGNTYTAKGEYDEAIKLHKLSLKIRKQAYSNNPNHSDIAESYNNLGNAYCNKGEYNKAIKCYKLSLKINKQIYGEEANPSDIAENYNNLGEVYYAQKKYDQAIEYHQLSLNISQKVYASNPNHPNIAGSYNNLGNAYCDKGQYDQAISYYQLSLEMQRQVYGDSLVHPDIANSYNNLGKVYSTKGDQDQAIKYHKQALEIRKQVYVDSPQHFDIAKSYHNLGVSYLCLGDVMEAYLCSKKALESCSANVNPQLVSILRKFYNISVTQLSIEMFLQDNVVEARKYLEEISSKYAGMDFASTEFIILLNQHAGAIYEIDALLACISCQKAFLKADPELKYGNHYHNLACFYAAVGKVTEAYEAFCEALKYDSKANLHVEYAQFLLENISVLVSSVRPQDALEHLLIVISNNGDNSGLQYGRLEKNSICTILKKIIEQKNSIIQVNPGILACYLLIKNAQYLGLEVKEAAKLLEELTKRSNNSQDEIAFRLLADVASEAGEQQQSVEYLEYAELMDQIEESIAGKASAKTQGLQGLLSKEKVSKYAHNLRESGKLAILENRVEDALKLYIKLFKLQHDDLLKTASLQAELVVDELATIYLMANDIESFTYLKTSYEAKVNQDLVTLAGRSVEEFLVIDYQTTEKINASLLQQPLILTAQNIAVTDTDDKRMEDENDIKSLGGIEDDDAK